MPVKLTAALMLLLTGSNMAHANGVATKASQANTQQSHSVPAANETQSQPELPNQVSPNQALLSGQVCANLPIRVWASKDARPNAIVVAVHGLTQHSGTFETFANRLTALGYTFVALDQRGHGKWYHTNAWPEEGKYTNFEGSTNDLICLMQEIQNKFPTIPVYCLGESVGSAIAINAVELRPDLVDGLILVSAGTTPRLYAPLMVANDFIKGIQALHKQMDVTRYIMRYSSNDKRICLGMVTDPLSRQTLNPIEILKTRFFLAQALSKAKRIPPDMPVMLLTGGQDGIVDPKSTREIYDNLKSSDKKMVWLPECGHVLLGTTFLSDSVVNAISGWLSQEALLANQYENVKAQLVAKSQSQYHPQLRN